MPMSFWKDLTEIESTLEEARELLLVAQEEEEEAEEESDNLLKAWLLRADLPAPISLYEIHQRLQRLGSSGGGEFILQGLPPLLADHCVLAQAKVVSPNLAVRLNWQGKCLHVRVAPLPGLEPPDEAELRPVRQAMSTDRLLRDPEIRRYIQPDCPSSRSLQVGLALHGILSAEEQAHGAPLWWPTVAGLVAFGSRTGLQGFNIVVDALGGNRQVGETDGLRRWLEKVQTPAGPGLPPGLLDAMLLNALAHRDWSFAAQAQPMRLQRTPGALTLSFPGRLTSSPRNPLLSVLLSLNGGLLANPTMGAEVDAVLAMHGLPASNTQNVRDGVVLTAALTHPRPAPPVSIRTPQPSASTPSPDTRVVPPSPAIQPLVLPAVPPATPAPTPLRQTRPTLAVSEPSPPRQARPVPALPKPAAFELPSAVPSAAPPPIPLEPPPPPVMQEPPPQVATVVSLPIPGTGGELRSWRLGRGWTQVDAANHLGVKQPAISKAEIKVNLPLGEHLQEAIRTLLQKG